MIEGKRIILRPLLPADAPIWAAWFNDPAVTEHMNKGTSPVTESRQVEFLAELSNSRSDVQFGIVVRRDSLLIGSIGIHQIDWIHRHGSISILLGNRDYWGKQFGTEAIGLVASHAFLKMNLHRLNAGMWSSNVVARSCFEKNGFQFEGARKENYFHRNGYVDELCFGLLKNDWDLHIAADTDWGQ